MFHTIYIVVFVIQLCSSQEVQRDPRTLQEDLSSLKSSMEEFMNHWTDYSIIKNHNDNIQDYNDNLEKNNYAGPVDRDIGSGEDNHAVGETENNANGNIENNDATETAPANVQEEPVILDEGTDDAVEETTPDPEDVNTSATDSIRGPVITEETGASGVAAETPREPDEGVPEGSLSFEGPVHAQGKVSVGAHYGPYGLPPPYYPDPWMYMPPYMPNPYMMYPYDLYMPDCYEYYMPEHDTGKHSDKKGHFPVPNIKAKHYCDVKDKSGESDKGNVIFNGMVPSGGTVSIAARY